MFFIFKIKGIVFIVFCFQKRVSICLFFIDKLKWNDNLIDLKIVTVNRARVPFKKKLESIPFINN